MACPAAAPPALSDRPDRYTNGVDAPPPSPTSSATRLARVPAPQPVNGTVRVTGPRLNPGAATVPASRSRSATTNRDISPVVNVASANAQHAGNRVWESVRSDIRRHSAISTSVNGRGPPTGDSTTLTSTVGSTTQIPSWRKRRNSHRTAARRVRRVDAAGARHEPSLPRTASSQNPATTSAVTSSTNSAPSTNARSTNRSISRPNRPAVRPSSANSRTSPRATFDATSASTMRSTTTTTSRPRGFEHQLLEIPRELQVMVRAAAGLANRPYAGS